MKKLSLANRDTGKHQTRHPFLKKHMIWICLLLVFSGCAVGGGGKAPVVIDYYALEYTSPAFKDYKQLSEVLYVERFSVAQAINTPMMVSRTKAFSYDTDYYNRWRVNPGDMITDYLLRDLRNSGIFKAVFSYRDTEYARFSMHGSVEDFLETHGGGGGKASLTIHVSLLDRTQREIDKKVIFQKKYHIKQSLSDNSAAGLAQAMSLAMEEVSRQIITDTYQSINRLK